jgi:hypothetical protein
MPRVALDPRREPATEPDASTVPADNRRPASLRSCSASALALNSKLSRSIESLIPRFYNLLVMPLIP